MAKQFKFFMWMVVCAMLSSCATTNLPWGFSFKRYPDKGVVFASIMYSGFLTANTIFIRKVGGDDESTMTFGTMQGIIPPSGDFVKYGYDSFTHKGGLVAEDLEPGNYVVYGWMVGESPVARNIEIPFTIKSGEVTYIGSYEFVHTTSGLQVTGGGGTLLDKYDRDLTVFKQKYPSMKHFAVTDAIANLELPMDLGTE